MRVSTCFAALALLAMAASALQAEWSVQLPFPLTAGSTFSALSDSMYYINDENGTVWGINTTTRKVQWSLRWDDIQQLLVFPQVDTLVVALAEGTWGVSASTGKLKWVNNTFQFTGLAVQSSDTLIGVQGNTLTSGISTVTAFDAATGSILWATPGTVAPAIDREVGIITGTNATSGLNFITGVNLRTGKNVWTQQPITQFVGVGERKVLTLNVSATFTNDLLVFDTQTGNVLGKIRNLTSADSVTATFTPEGFAVLTDSMSFIKAVNLTSFTVAWTAQLQVPSLPFGVQALFVSANHIVAQGNANSSSQNQLWNLTAFRKLDGLRKWSIHTPPIVAANTVLFIGGDTYVPNLEGYTQWSEMTGDLKYVTYRESIPVAPGTIQTEGWLMVAASATGLVSAFRIH